jgi:iron complex outermembrane receptor protein
VQRVERRHGVRRSDRGVINEAGRQLANGVSFFVEGRNPSNTKYGATTGVIATANGQDSAQFWPGDGRSVYAGIEWRM